MIRRNSGHVQQGGLWASSPRTKLVLFFVSFAVTYGAIRVWQIIIESDNVFLETAAAFVTVVIIFGIYWYYMRQYTAYRRRMNELRQAHPLTTPEEELDLNMMQLRLYLRRVYGNSVNIDALLTNSGGLSVETIDSLVRHFTFSSHKGSEGKESCTHINENTRHENSMIKGTTDVDLELGLCHTVSHITDSPSVSRGCSIDAAEYHIVRQNDNNCDNTCNTTIKTQCICNKCINKCDSSSCNRNNQSITPESNFGPEECSVCLSEYYEGDNLTELPCHHIYHRVCITEWLMRHNACPMCKQMVLQLPLLWDVPGDVNSSGTSGISSGVSSGISSSVSTGVTSSGISSAIDGTTTDNTINASLIASNTTNTDIVYTSTTITDTVTIDNVNDSTSAENIHSVSNIGSNVNNDSGTGVSINNTGVVDVSSTSVDGSGHTIATLPPPPTTNTNSNTTNNTLTVLCAAYINSTLPTHTTYTPHTTNIDTYTHTSPYSTHTTLTHSVSEHAPLRVEDVEDTLPTPPV